MNNLNLDVHTTLMVTPLFIPALLSATAIVLLDKYGRKTYSVLDVVLIYIGSMACPYVSFILLLIIAAWKLSGIPAFKRNSNKNSTAK